MAGLILLFYIRRAIVSRSIKQYTPGQLQDRLQSPPPPLLLDVRTEDEHRSGAIKGSFHIPVQELHRRAGELAKHKEREVICYCQTGSRSMTAALALKKMGYTAGNLKGGMAEWKFAQLAGGKR
jgi:rhodanese-related sulfurtransferase